jgi:uncharacterized protein (TIGR03000 family)
MYSAVLMLALATGMDATEHGRRGGGCSGYGGGYGCCGGGYYGGGYRTYYGGGGYYGPSYAYMPGSTMPGSYYSNGFYGSTNYYGPSVYTQNQAPEIRQSYYMNPSQNFASVRVLLPNPEAEVWFDDAPTQQRGFERFYHSPPLDPSSNYRYTIKARWMENGQTVNQERRVDVRPGQAAFVDFRTKQQGGAGEQIDNPRNNPNPNPNPNPNVNPNPNPNPNPVPPNPKTKASDGTTNK